MPFNEMPSLVWWIGAFVIAAPLLALGAVLITLLSNRDGRRDLRPADPRL